MNRIVWRALIVSMFCMLPVRAFIYNVQVLRRWQSSLGKYQHVIGLSDYHDKRHPATQRQRAQLEGLLQRCNKKDSYVLVEDLSSPNTKTGHSGCGCFKINSRGGILGGLSTLCQEKRIPVANVEYRFCRVAALGPVLNNTRQSLDTFKSSNAILVRAVRDEIMHTIARIRTFRDGPFLQKYYDKYARQVESDMDRFHLNMHPNETTAHYMATHSRPLMRGQVVKKLLTFDSVLLDLDITHSVVGAQDKDTILVIAGGSHIKNSCDLLQKVGYEQVYNSRIAYDHEKDLRQCTGSHIVRGRYCVKPAAIDLSIVKKYID